MEVLHRKCAGLDVHKDTVVACARTMTGHKVTREVETFGKTTRELLRLVEWLEKHEVTITVMEATGVYWRPVWHILEGHGELVLANAHEVRNVPGRKSDVNDAMWLADLVACGLVRSSFVPPEPIQDLRDLTRTRKQLTREIVGHTQRIQRLNSVPPRSRPHGRRSQILHPTASPGAGSPLTHHRVSGQFLDSLPFSAWSRPRLLGSRPRSRRRLCRGDRRPSGRRRRGGPCSRRAGDRRSVATDASLMLPPAFHCLHHSLAAPSTGILQSRFLCRTAVPKRMA
jgi:hypothetical protein